jgi:sortase A
MVLRWLERGLLISGAAALIWCGVLVADLLIAQRSAREALRTTPPAEQPLLAPALEDESGPAPEDEAVETGAAIASLSIPRIGLSAAVLHGSDARTLRRGPGHLEKTAYPGQPGNVVIAGHRDSFFWPLRNIQLGDDILLDAPNGQFHYRVTAVRVVNSRDLSVLAPTSEPMLTLITCYPFWVLGPAPERFVVRAAARVNGPVAAGTTPAPALEDAAPAHDDDVLVRLAVERFRVSNGLTFDSCEIGVDRDAASASCAGALGLPRRTFSLQRTAGGWAIRSIVLHEDPAPSFDAATASQPAP